MAEERRRESTVLLVDDDRQTRDELRQFFANTSYRVAGDAADGMEAVAMCRSLRPDLVLLDVKMPLLDGISAARMIREDASAHCVVMLTSFDDRECVNLALAAGAAGYLTKPLQRGDILPTLEVCLGHSKKCYLLEKNRGSLKRRLAGRETVDRAKLALMEERALSEEEAYNLIRELSRRKNLSMEQVARFLLERGNQPHESDHAYFMPEIH